MTPLPQVSGSIVATPGGLMIIRRYAVKILFAGAAIAALAIANLPVHAQQPTTLLIGSYGGALDDIYRRVLKPFEEKFNVTIKMVPGTSAENAAKLVATKNNPEYDLVFLENLSHDAASRQGALATIDETIVTNYRDLSPKTKLASKDGMPVGHFIAGIFYNAAEFQKRGWAAPTGWSDLFRPELCKNIGVLHPNVSYGMHMVMMLGGGDPAKISDGVARLGQLKDCIPTLEPSASKFEEKIQLGEYLIGVHGNIRVLPLIRQGLPLKYIVPKEGSILGSSITAAAKNSRHAKLTQELMNWLIAPESQKILMESTFYVPVNTKVEVTPEMQALGMPDSKTLERVNPADAAIVSERRREWVRQVERAMSR